MKRELTFAMITALIILLLGFKSNAGIKVPPGPKKFACSIHKIQGKVKVKCADNDKYAPDISELVPMPDPVVIPPAATPKSLHIKDATGTEFTNLVHMTSMGSVSETVLNITTGNVLSYDASGALTTITKTYYESTDCTGMTYAYPSSGQSFKNRIFINVNAAPLVADAFKVIGFASGLVTFRSQYQAGVCSSMNAPNAGFTIVEPTALNVADPLTIALPLELIFN